VKSPKCPFRKLVLPLAILAPLLWLMAGCLYVPWFEHRIDSGPNVRELVGSSGDKLVPGRVTRAQITNLLGEAPYVSGDGNAIGYVTTTSVGTWVYPLCFGAETADARVYVLRLVFDPAGKLVRHDWADASEFRSPSFLIVGHGSDAALNAAISKLNRTGPILHRRLE
jgi:hypothetical protein